MTFQHSSIVPFAAAQTLFPNTKLAEDRIEQVFGGGLADDFADGIDGDAQIHGDQLQRLVRTKGLHCAKGGAARAIECLLMARIDHYLQHLGFDLARPSEFFDRVLQRVDAFAR